MKKQKSAAKQSKSGSALGFRLREGAFILQLSFAMFFLLALTTFSHHDPGWSQVSGHGTILNAAGPMGAWCADVLISLFGALAFGFPAMVALSSAFLFLHRHEPSELDYPLLSMRVSGFCLALVSGCTLASIYFADYASTYPFGAGGILGITLSEWMLGSLHITGSTLLLLTSFLVGITFATGLSWLRLMDKTGRTILKFLRASQRGLIQAKQRLIRWHQARQLSRTVISTPKKEPVLRLPKPKSAPAPVPLEEEVPSISEKIRVIRRKNTVAQQVPLFNQGPDGPMPSLSLLDIPAHKEEAIYSEEALHEMSRLVESKLADFNVEAQVVAVHPGPVITRYELQLAAGIKASKITGLAKDLARSLAMVSVRVVEIIPGKPYVGLELPNVHRQTVYLSELFGSEAYQNAASPLTIALGKDIAGVPTVADLGKMPHLLVAGTTGSGKSVGLNGMLLSILFKATPEEVRLIMIDPKMLELSVYDDIPHLLAPVVTDMKEAANALKWCVAEMERRYRLMAALGVRNLASYNRKVLEAKANNQPIMDPLFKAVDPDDEPSELQNLPYIVVVVDEFADMIMVVGKKVEELIARIAQKARAAGIHLILATQRPSVDVITGLIKANVPTRIAFQVASRIDSRTILDQQGAEQLLGKGDMLYLPVGAGIPTRIHGAFVSDQEVHACVNDWKKRGRPDYLDEIVSGAGGFGMAALGLPEFDDEESDPESDPLYDQAVEAVIESGRASISMVQRRLKIGYNRAARLIEQMEAAGLVSPMQSNGSRELLVPHAKGGN
jgi:DNA segregation ATPase FtsK/SpoIIIE, S-DNA-T family